jgi:phosphohistidine phosphatase SixA
LELTLLRHGIPIDPSEWSASDATRPLTPEGRIQTRAVIAVLLRQGKLATTGMPGALDAIWCSPYLRTQQTAQIAAEVLRMTSPTAVPELGSGSDLIRSLSRRLTQAQVPARLMCVGHMPDLGNLIARLSGAPAGSYGLGRAGTARLTGDFRPGGMKLEWLLTAEETLATTA